MVVSLLDQTLHAGQQKSLKEQLSRRGHCTRLWSSCVSLATNSPAAQTYDTVS